MCLAAMHRCPPPRSQHRFYLRSATITIPYPRSLYPLSHSPFLFPFSTADILSPLYSLPCARRIVEEYFDLAADPTLEQKYVMWPLGPTFERSRTWMIDRAQGIMIANGTAEPCSRKRSQTSYYGPLSTQWPFLTPPANFIMSRTTANISLLTPRSVAGVTVRLQDQLNMYVAEFRTRNVTLVRMVGGGRTVLAIRNLNYTLEGGAWSRVGIRATNRVIEVMQYDRLDGNESVLINFTDTSYFWGNGAGTLFVAPDSLAAFDDYVMDVGCDLGK